MKNLTLYLLFFLISSFFMGCSTSNKSAVCNNDNPLMMAYMYTLLGRDGKVPGELESYLKEHPHDKDCYIACINSYLKTEDYEHAYQLVQQYLANNEPSYDFYYLRGVVFFQTEQYDQALTDFNHGIELIKNSADPSITANYLSGLKIQLSNYKKEIEANASYNIRNYDTTYLVRDYEKARKKFIKAKKIYDINNACIEMLNRRAYLYIREGDYKNAENDYASAFSIDPENIKTFQGKAYLDRKRGNYKSALAQYSQALECEEDNPELYKYRAEINMRTKDYQKAYDDFTEALRKDPEDIDNILGQAKSLYGLQKYRQSVDVVSKYLLYRNKLTEYNLLQGYHLRAAAYLYLKQYQLAVNDYTKILEISRDNREARFQRAVVYNVLKNPAAIADFQRIAQVEPDNSDVLCELAIAHMHKSNFDESEKFFKKSIKANPSNYRAYGNFGYLWYRIKSDDSWILNCLNKSIELNPEYIPAYFYKYFHYRDKEYYGLALEQLDKILGLRKNMYKAHFYKAIIYEFLKDKDNAVKEYKKAVKHSPSESDITAEFSRGRIKELSSNVALKDIKPQNNLRKNKFSQIIDEKEASEPVSFQFVVSQRFYPAQVADAGSGVNVSYSEVTNEYGEKEYVYDPEGEAQNTRLDSKEHINAFRQDIVNLIIGDKVEGVIVNESYNQTPDENVLVFDIPQKNLKQFVNELKLHGETQTLLGPFVDQMDNIQPNLDSNDLMRIRITLDISRDISN